MKTNPILALFFVLLLSVASAHHAYGQAGGQRFEAGGQIATLSLGDSDATNTGFGGRVSYDFSRWLTADGEFNHFGNDSFERNLPAIATLPGVRVAYSRRRLDGFFGAKVGVRGSRFGVFGKVRPGFTRLYNKGINCVGDLCALMLFAPPEYRTEFALDLGGVVEFYPTARTVTRVDLGSTVIRNRGRGVPPCGDCTTRNFSSRIGVGLRF